MTVERNGFLKNRTYPDCADTVPRLRPVAEMVNGPALLKELEGAVRTGRVVTVYGDYDADGIMASYIYITGLSRLLPGRVRRFTNHRLDDGYGITEASMRKCLEREPDTEVVLTCDNGINAAEAVGHAMDRGITVLVTDHHEQTVPLRPDCPAVDERSAAQKESDEAAGVTPEAFCGAELARRVVEALYERLGIAGEERKLLDGLYAYAAFATIADHVPMNAANHYVGRRGLLVMRQREGFWGLLQEENALVRRQRSIPKMCGDTISFTYAPMVNASSRMTGSAEQALAMLLSWNSGDEAACRSAVRELVELNERRKELSRHDDETAFRLIEERGYQNDPFILLADPRFSEGVNGLTATHVTERFGVPSAVLSPTAHDPDVYKGSARSVEGFDLVRALTSCGELIRAGGHPMAAGLQVDRQDLEEARQLLIRKAGAVPRTRREREPDLVFTPAELTLETAETVCRLTDELEPFGPGFEEPVTEIRGTVRDIWAIGEEHAKFLLQNSGDRRYVSAIWWNHLREAREICRPGQEFRFAGKLEPNVYRNNASIQLILQKAPEPV